MIKKFIGLWYLTALLLGSAAYAQGVSCNNKVRLNLTEKTIFHNPKLSALDNQLNKLYQQAMQVSSAPNVLKQNQLVWLRNNRDLCANDKKCLTTTYQQRLRLLAEVIANPKAPIPQYYPVRWDHSIDLPSQKPSPDYPKFKNDDHSSNMINVGLNSKNPCVQMFLQQSVPAKQSNVANYQFTKNTLNELPPNIGFEPSIDRKQLINGFLAGQSRKAMDPQSKIIYLRPYEIIFTDNMGVYPPSLKMTGIDAVKLKIIAWGGDKQHKHSEDMLLYENENAQINKKLWSGWENGAIDAYIIATKKAHETRLRTKGFYRVIKGNCSLIPWTPVTTKVINEDYDVPLLFVPTFDLRFPN